MTAAFLALVGTAGAASIGECNGDHAPAAYRDETCSGTNICTIDGSGSTIHCTDLTGNDTAGAEVFAVEDYNQTGARAYSVFGTVDGADFCCFINDTGTPHEIISIVLEGTDFDDQLNFSYTTRNVSHATTTANGNDGDDILFGSDSTSQHDLLEGGSDQDTISGQRGNDDLCGNDVDQLWEPSSSNAPTGSGSQTGDQCGHPSFTSGWAGSYCNYVGTSRPSQCP